MKLQLAFARERAARTADPSAPAFRRIVWAPKILDASDQPAIAAVERDPLKVLERFDCQLPTDKIDGDILSKFIEFLFQYLAENAPRRVPKTPADGKLEVYLAYHGADEDYAGALVEALRGSPMKIQIPASGSDAETRRYNDDLLINCDAVTLCWANASEVWVRSEADKLKDWETLGRKQQFAFRSLIAGPPPAPHKRAQFIKLLFQDGQIDQVLDLVDKGSPTPELLADLAPAPMRSRPVNAVLEPAAQAVASPSPAPGAAGQSALSAERPFPGLRPFAFADRDYFFGRNSQIFALYRLVEHGRFVAVIGSSGSGKSSLVLAGLCRLLAEESEDPGGPQWAYLDMRPGASPLRRLAEALARLARGDSADESARRRDRIEYRLRQSGFSLKDALDEAGGLNGRSLLLVVDQFEELFRFGLAGLGQRRPGVEEARQRDEATQFVQILLDADRRRTRARARAHHHALRFHRRLRLFPWPVGGGERDPVSGAESDPRPARGGHPQADRKSGRRHRAGTGGASAQRLRRRARPASGAAALPDAAVEPGGRGDRRRRRSAPDPADLRRHRAHGRGAVTPRR